jgi:hypothetical protein
MQLMQRRRRSRRRWLCGGSDDEVIASKASQSNIVPKSHKIPGSLNRFTVADTRTGSSSTGGDESSNSNDSRDGISLLNTTPLVPEWKAGTLIAHVEVDHFRITLLCLSHIPTCLYLV